MAGLRLAGSACRRLRMKAAAEAAEEAEEDVANE